MIELKDLPSRGRGMRIFGSFSMGRSSAKMCGDTLPKLFPEAEIIYGTANTGKEHDLTLVFGDRCDRHFGLNLTWVEAVVNPGREGCTHRVVTFDTASRLKDADKDGHPFKEVVRKYGIPNVDFPHCTRELKLNPMRSYLRSIGWEPGTYYTAIGYRADEKKRFGKNAARDLHIYPLALAGIEKPDVNDYWKAQPFDLEIEECEGNCVDCFKKTDLKHVRNIKRNPHWYDLTRAMERDFHTLPITDPDDAFRFPMKYAPRAFFRKNRTTEHMLALAATFDEAPNPRYLSAGPDRDAGCGESCEAFQGELFEETGT